MGSENLYVYVRRVSDDQVVLRKRWLMRWGMPNEPQLLDRAAVKLGARSDEFYVDDFEILDAFEKDAEQRSIAVLSGADEFADFVRSGR